MVIERVLEEVKLVQVELFDPSRSYLNYTLCSSTGETHISFNCVEKHSKVNLGDAFTKLFISEAEPTGVAAIHSMEVKLVSVGTDFKNSLSIYKFEGTTKPYSEVYLTSKNLGIENITEMIGKVLFVGLK